MKGQISRDFIQLLLNRIDIVDLIDGRVPLRKKSGNNFFACCPFHQEKSPSFSVSQAKQFYHCFGCGVHGNAIDFLIQYDRLTFPEAVEVLAKQCGMEIPQKLGKSSHHVPSMPLYSMLEKVSCYYQNQLRQNEQAIQYLKGRGVLGALAKKFHLGYASMGWDHLLKSFHQSHRELLDSGLIIKKEGGGFYDRFRDRIMFPIQDRRGRIVGFGGRILDKGEPKYLNSPETPIFQKGRELYGLYQALQANRQLKQVMIVEGYMDVIALFQHGISYAVATLGTATTTYHIERLCRYTSDIIFCFDGDTAGRTAAWRALEVVLSVMKDGLQIRFLFLPENEDPDTFIRKEGKEKFEERIQHAFTLSEFFFRQIAKNIDLNNMDGRARYVKLATDYLNRIPAGIFQQMMFEELAKKTRTTLEQLKATSAPSQSLLRTANRKARSPSALRLVMILLVQQPSLVQYLTESLPKMNALGFDFFEKLVAFIQQHPGLNTGALLEYWRDQPEANLLSKLAQWEHMIPEKGIKTEFLDAIKRLQERARAEMIEQLLTRAAQQELTSQEKQELTRLIRAKSE